MKHNKTDANIDESDVKKSFLRTVIHNGESKMISLTQVLKDWKYVEVQVIANNDKETVVRIVPIGTDKK